MEVEGKAFQIFKSPLPTQDRPRTDKLWSFNVNQIENIPNPDAQGFGPLATLCRQITFLPFELNIKNPQDYQLQICENFEVSYFDDQEHTFIKPRRDNYELTNSQDVGTKMTIFYIVNMDNKADKEYGTLFLKEDSPDSKEETFSLRNNCLVMIKSRLCGYKIEAKSQKVFVMMMKVGGPKGKTF